MGGEGVTIESLQISAMAIIGLLSVSSQIGAKKPKPIVTPPTG